MIFDCTLILILLIILFSSIFRSAFGFGDALIAMPLLAFFLNIQTAAPLVALVGFSISIFILIRHWKSAYTKGLWLLILFSIFGIPIGLFFLKNSDDKIVKILLSVIIIISSSINLIKTKKLELKNDKFAWVAGIISGILGGAYNINGPPVIIYGKLKNWDPQKFRAILQSVFFPTNLFIIIGQGSTGFWTPQILNYYLVCLPVIIIGTIVGGIINRKFPKDYFVMVIDYLLIIIGIILLIINLFK